MKHERSAGAVLYKIVNNKLYFLVEHMNLGHISIPKGHVEGNETLEETCKREIKEETNLEVIEWDFSFSQTITYIPHVNGSTTPKDVTFFIGKILEDTIPEDNHDTEVDSLEYLPFDEAIKIITHDTDKNVLAKAYSYIKSKENLL